MKYCTLIALLAFADPAAAQAPLVNPSRVAFESSGHTTVLSDLVTPEITTYQGLLFDVNADAATATPLVTGPAVPKSLVVVLTPTTTPPSYTLTLAQLGIVPPPCTLPQANCPVYKATLIAARPGASSARSTATGPFSAGSTAVPPVAPANVRALP
jgi:hypothetical protein